MPANLALFKIKDLLAFIVNPLEILDISFNKKGVNFFSYKQKIFANQNYTQIRQSDFLIHFASIGEIENNNITLDKNSEIDEEKTGWWS